MDKTQEREWEEKQAQRLVDRAIKQLVYAKVLGSVGRWSERARWESMYLRRDCVRNCCEGLTQAAREEGRKRRVAVDSPGARKRIMSILNKAAAQAEGTVKGSGGKVKALERALRRTSKVRNAAEHHYQEERFWDVPTEAECEAAIIDAQEGIRISHELRNG